MLARRFIDEIEITEERKEFKKTNDPKTGTYTLTIEEIRAELSGKYTIQISNDLGTVKSSAALAVQCKFPLVITMYLCRKLLLDYF